MLKLNDFHDYQHGGVTMLYEHNSILSIVPTGGGKTIMSLTAFAELQKDNEVRRGIVLAPKRVAYSVWPKEAQEWEQTAHLEVIAALGTAKNRKAVLNDPDIDLSCHCINNIDWLYDEVLTWDADDPRLDLLIFDEVSKCKDPRGAWAKTLRKLVPLFKNYWPTTGSPRPNGELDWFVVMATLSSNKLWGRSFDKWRREHFFPVDYDQRDWRIHRHCIDQINADVAKHSFKVPMSAVPRPASDPIIHEITLPKSVREKYKTMEKKLFAKVNGLDILAINAAVSSGKLSQMCQGFLYDEDKFAHSLHHAKMDVLKDLVRDTGDASAIVYWFNEDIKRLYDALPDLVHLGEGVSDKRAIEIEEEWNKGNIQHLAIHPASAGHGLNLQKTVAQLVHYSLTWSAELYDQVVARIARQGYVGDKKDWLVLNHHIVAKNTVDEMKMSRVAGKLSAQAAAMEYIKSV